MTRFVAADNFNGISGERTVMGRRRVLMWTIGFTWLLAPGGASAQYRVENLGRGVVALRTSATTAYVGWRLLGTDPADLAFNVYRSTGGGPGFFLGDGMAPPPAPPVVHADTNPPAFKTLAASQTVLWPPHHDMVPVTLTAEAVDLLDPSPSVRVIAVVRRTLWTATTTGTRRPTGRSRSRSA